MSESTLTGRPVTTEPGATVDWQARWHRTRELLAARSMVPVWLLLIVVVAALFRFTGRDWDQGTHRHPDERHLTMVVERVRWPSSFSEYLNEQTSPLNPRNNDFAWFYGDFAITIVKRVAVTLNDLTNATNDPWDSYGRGHLLGRTISALFDMGTLLLLFLLARKLYNDTRIALLAAFLFSVTVLPIQHSHFWVVDNFVTFFVTLTLYWLVCIFKAEGAGNPGYYLLAGLFFGVSLAIKASVFTLAAVFGMVAIYKLWSAWQESPSATQAMLEGLMVRMGLAVAFTLLAFRILQPYAFQGPGLLDVGLSPRWLGHMEEVQGQVTGEADPPWGYQWANRTPIIFPLKNMVLWGMGLPLGIAVWVGWGAALWQMVRRERWVHLIPVVWVLVLFLHQGTQWVKSMRYFLPIYPMLILLAAWLLVWLWRQAQAAQHSARTAGLFAWTPTKAGLIAGIVLVGTFLYALAFTNLYRNPHTHLQAAAWIYQNIPSGAIVAQEHYDEGIPFGIPEMNPEGRIYRGLTVVDPGTGAISEGGQLNWYYEDNPTKLEDALKWLDEAQYIVTLSNRLYGSTARLPARFPMTVNYYQALFSGELGWERVADFTEGPQLLGIELDDQFSAEEAFTVYDHPRVQIFRKTDAYDREKARAILSEGVDWNNISRLTAKDWTESGGRALSLKFTPAERSVYESSGTWSRIFDRDSLANRFPLPWWMLVVQLLGLLALPYLHLVARSLPERGFIFAKPLGLLLVAWLTWFLASLKLVPFSRGSIGLSMLLVGIGGLLLLLRGGSSAEPLPARLQAWWRDNWRLFLLAEVVFWAFFVLVLLVRWANPDLWHQDLGGEKPMDLSYLNAVIKSPYFPPMDPWFAGGYINYYYFGFVLVATLTKFTGILPAMTYNLAIPTLFAMMAAGTWAAALALLVPLTSHDHPTTLAEPTSDEGETHSSENPPFTQHPAPSTQPLPRRALLFATLAALFVAVLGNLGELEVVARGLSDLSQVSFTSGIPGLQPFVRAMDGLVRGVILNGQTLAGRLEWPYWNATRTIPETINEFPWFTFLYADLHAHMMALPYTLLAIGLSLSFLRAPLQESRVTEGLRLFLLALTLGALWPINTWDFPTYALVAFAGLGLREWRRDGAITPRGILAVAWRWALMLGLGRLLLQPFHSSYGSAYTSVERWHGSLTGLGDFLTVHGMFLFAIFFALVGDFLFGRGHNPPVRLARFLLRHLMRRGRASHLYRLLVRGLPLSNIYLLVPTVLFLALLPLLATSLAVRALTFVLLFFALFLFFRSRPQPLWQMVLFFIILGLGLTLAVEIVVLKGDVGRMNTVFKFYLQVWVLWGIGAALGSARVLEQRRHWLPEWRAAWGTGLALLVGIALLYPIFATHAKINDRYDRSVGATLDGAAFMERATYTDHDRARNQPVAIPLKWDADAIRWMQENVPGSPTIAEINTAPDRVYGWGNRFAMWTGNPAIVGWDNHQRQQRAAANSEEVNQRVREVRDSIYNTPDAAFAHETLLRFGADYLIVGALERAYTSDEGLAKFEPARGRFWDLVYENQDVKIYRVLE